MKTLNLIITTAIIAVSANCFAAGTTKMAGTYTIGGNATANFKTISEAVIALESNGVNGPVTFKVENQVYNQNDIISAIQKISVMGDIAFVNADEDNSTATTDATDAATFTSK